jgi:hypothetical protein
MKKIFKKLRAGFAYYLWEKSFGEDFFDEFPEVQKKIADKIFKILED